MTNHETRCPNCQHDQHLPGTECGATVGHGPNRWHLCLCLARPGAALPCPPQMTCQGGTLGYADVWYLQQGHSLSSADGVISPEVLGPVAVGFPTPDAAAPAAVSVPPPATRADADRERIAAALYRHEWPGKQVWEQALAMDRETFLAQADAVLAVLPAPADRAAVLREAAAAIEAEQAREEATEWAQQDELDPETEAGGAAVRAMAGLLRRMAAEEQQPAPGPCVAGEQQNETPEEALPFIHVDDDSDQLEIGAVMASTYDGEAPVVYVATEQHQGDQVATVYVRPERVERVVAALRSARRAAETLPDAVDQPGKEPAAGVRQDGAQPHEPPVVAYRSPGGHYLYCTRHPNELGASWTPLLSDDLPDGGLCAHSGCGVDVLLTQQGAEK